jgi:hypothetical protein
MTLLFHAQLLASYRLELKKADKKVKHYERLLRSDGPDSEREWRLREAQKVVRVYEKLIEEMLQRK